ncbi:hypothetical protein JL722_3037 [Aureococcus anophagefferens]|nr:hypothetical protein JL722_3037 [Aureococcus anophagefferens]
MASAAINAAKKRKTEKRELREGAIAMTMLQRSSQLFGFGKNSVKVLAESADGLAVDEAEGDEPHHAHAHPMNWRYYQEDAEFVYQHIYVQVGVAMLIFANFITNIIEAQIAINGNTKYEVRVFRRFEMFFFVIFLMELFLNMYSSWFWKFWKDSWNVFDFVTVSITVLDVAGLLAPDSPLRYLRMMRAFRVFRLFKRVKSLNKIVVSLGKAMPGVMNAFLILTLVMCIYAILGYEFFHNYPCGDTGGPASCAFLSKVEGQWDPLTESPPPIMCEKGDAPGYGLLTECRAQYTFGQEYFGNFLKSFYTLFQVLTGESWSEAIARPLMEQSPGLAAGYFISFILINGVVLINVVVAVLLEKMVDDEEEEEEEEEDPAHPGEHHAHHKAPNIAQIYEERQQERKNVEARLDNLQAQMDTLLKVLNAQHGGVVPLPTNGNVAYDPSPATARRRESPTPKLVDLDSP